MNDDTEHAAERIAERGQQELVERLRAAFEWAAADTPGLSLGPEDLGRLIAEAAPRADGALWRRSLAGAAAEEFGITLGAAVSHPAVIRAHELVGAPPYEPPPSEPPASAPPASSVALSEPTGTPGDAQPPEAEDEQLADTDTLTAEPDALRLPAVHIGGIEALRAGERDLELRLSDAGLDVLKRSSGATIGRLEWTEIRQLDLPRSKRGLRGRRRVQEMHVATDRGRATFELPDLTEEQLKEHLEPMLARTYGRDVSSEPA